MVVVWFMARAYECKHLVAVEGDAESKDGEEEAVQPLSILGSILALVAMLHREKQNTLLMKKVMRKVMVMEMMRILMRWKLKRKLLYRNL